MNAAFNQDKTVLAILILAIALQMLTNGHRLFDQAVKILRDLGSQTYTHTYMCMLLEGARTHTNPTISTQNTYNLVASKTLDLANSMRVTKDGTNLTGR